jgi:thioredoxin-related protein
MKKLLILMFVAYAAATTASAQKSIQFQDKTFAELQKAAKEENKMIFIVFSASWCGPCKKMEKEVYTEAQVADFYNSHFICAHFDSEKGEGKELAKKYKVRLLPGFLFFSHGGEIELEDFGFQKKDDFIRIGSNAGNPEINFSRQIGLKDSAPSADSSLAVLAFFYGRNFEPLPQSKRAMKSVLKFLKENSVAQIRVEGFSNDPDRAFMDEHLIYMAMLRAISVRDFFVSRGIETGRIHISGHIARDIITSDAESLIKGERVEIKPFKER